MSIRTGAVTVASTMTTLDVSGNVTLGDAATDVVTIPADLAHTGDALGFFSAAAAARPAAYTQTYATADRTHAARGAGALTNSTGGTDPADQVFQAMTNVQALTDSTTGAAATTLAAGVGLETVVLPINFASIADGDVLTTYVPGYKFKILGFAMAVNVPVTTAAKGTTLNLEIDVTNTTGGSLVLTSANMTPQGAVVTSTAITAANTGSSSASISVEAASTTTFIEGSGYILIKLQNMDTADAFASLANEVATQRTLNTAMINTFAQIVAEHNLLRTDHLDTAQLLNSVIDDGQTLGLLQ